MITYPTATQTLPSTYFVQVSARELDQYYILSAFVIRGHNNPLITLALWEQGKGSKPGRRHCHFLSVWHSNQKETL